MPAVCYIHPYKLLVYLVYKDDDIFHRRYKLGVLFRRDFMALPEARFSFAFFSVLRALMCDIPSGAIPNSTIFSA
jgi:hypothetical protein